MNNSYTYHNPRHKKSFGSLYQLFSNKLSKFAIVYALLLAVAITTYQVMKIQDTRGFASYPGGVLLSFATPNTTVALNDVFTVNVMLDTRSLGVTGTEIKIDVPQHLQVMSVTNSNLLPTEFVSPVIGPSSVHFVFASPPTAPQTQSGVLATLQVKAAQIGSAPLTFNDSVTLVTAVTIEQNVIETMSPLNITVSTSSTTTPTTAPIATPTPTPTSVPPTSAVDTTPPVVRITSPANNAIVSPKQNVTVTATAQDQFGIRNISIYSGSTLLKSCAAVTSCTRKYRFPIGTHNVRAVAQDNANNSSEASITVTSR